MRLRQPQPGDAIEMSPPTQAAALLPAASLIAARERGSRRWADAWSALMVAVVAASLCLPFLHSVYWLGDEGVLLGGGERLLHGEHLYRDFFEFLPPAGFVLTAAWLKAVGVSLMSARILAGLTIAVTAAFAYLGCRQVCGSRLYPALVVLAWLVATQGYWTEISHHWFATLFAVIAAWAALRAADGQDQRLALPVIAGLAAGAAAMVVPTRGALAMLAGLVAFALPFASRRQLAYVLAGLAVPVGLLLYIVVTGALGAAFYDIIVFPARQYRSLNAAPYGYFVSLQSYPLLLLFPAAALLALPAWRVPARDSAGDSAGDSADRARLRTAAAFAVAGFVGCFPRPDAAHLGFAAPLALPLLVYALSRLTSGSLQRYRVAAASLAVVLCLPSVITFWVAAQRAVQAEPTPTARGAVAFLDNVAPVAQVMAQIAARPADERFFFYPLMPLLPFLSGREQVSPYDVFTPGYTLPGQYRETCTAVMARASWVVLDRDWMDPDFLRRIFPALDDPQRPEAERFETALRQSFGLVMRAGAFELRRREEPDVARCVAIAP